MVEEEGGVGRELKKKSLPDRQCVGCFQTPDTYDTQEDIWPSGFAARLRALT